MKHTSFNLLGASILFGSLSTHKLAKITGSNVRVVSKNVRGVCPNLKCCNGIGLEQHSAVAVCFEIHANAVLLSLKTVITKCAASELKPGITCTCIKTRRTTTVNLVAEIWLDTVPHGE